MRARALAPLAGLAGLALALGLAIVRLPPSGRGKSDVATSLVQRAVPEVHAMDAVSAVNFDYRSVDTLGEEYILFASVLGAATLLRRQRDEREDEADARERTMGARFSRASDAVRIFGAAVVFLMVIVGAYFAANGQLSPGGGFQGGVILASAPLVVFFVSDARTLRRITPGHMVPVAEAVGISGFILIGFAGVAHSRPFLTNVLPLGRTGDLLSAGTIFALSVSVALAVASGLLHLALEFMHDAIERRLAREKA
jgi:multicomponent Na+:H+ antiporter subunit B